MGTRSLTVMQDEHGDEIAVLYRQFDGYPSGHGAELAEFLSGFSVVNGFGMNPPEKQANGGSCLAAQIVAHFKEGVGQFYLYAAGTRNTGEEYIYVVKPEVGKEPVIRVYEAEWDKPTDIKHLAPAYEAPASEFLTWAKEGDK